MEKLVLVFLVKGLYRFIKLKWLFIFIIYKLFKEKKLNIMFEWNIWREIYEKKDGNRVRDRGKERDIM